MKRVKVGDRVRVTTGELTGKVGTVRTVDGATGSRERRALVDVVEGWAPRTYGVRFLEVVE